MNHDNTKPQHTPGPWQLQKGPSDEALHIFAPGKRFIITQNPGPDNINPNIISGNRYTFHTEREANARLIAAAPELLEALEAIRDAYGRTDNGQALALALSVKAGIAAIRKAKGEA